MNGALVKKIADLHYGGDQTAAREFLKASRTVLEAVEAVLQDKEEESRKTFTSDYDSPSWPYRRADQDGYNRALSEAASVVRIR